MGPPSSEGVDVGMRTLFPIAAVLWCVLVIYAAANSWWD